MSDLVADCPRCGASHTTFDLIGANFINEKYRWQEWHEAFCICRNCNKSTIFVLYSINSAKKEMLNDDGGLIKTKVSVNNFVHIDRYISLRDAESKPPPEHLPENIETVFKEGATCQSVGCYNAAGTMFRLCIDMVTSGLLPEIPANPEDEVAGLNKRIRRNLGLRLPWLFDNGHLPEALRDLAACVHQDGNDAAHAGTLTKDDAEDLLDFAFLLLERIYTEPKRLELAKTRREDRRAAKQEHAE